MFTKKTEAQIRAVMKLACWPIAVYLASKGKMNEAVMVAGFGEMVSGGASLGTKKD